MRHYTQRNYCTPFCNEEKRIKYEVYDFIIFLKEHVKQENCQFAEKKKILKNGMQNNKPKIK